MIHYEKYNGTSNDFVVVDADEPVSNRRALAAALCDRETGVEGADGRTGADGVLFLALEEGYSEPRVIMTLVQPDGSTAAMCGNGARCAAVWAVRRLAGSRDTDPTTVMIDTQAGTIRAAVDPGGVTLEMGTPSFDPVDVPLAVDEPLVEADVEGLTVTAVNTGVPHAVAFVDDVDAVDLEAVAPPVRHADVFPEGANVTLAAERGEGFAQRTYERGVEGETDSCGTGAVAIAAAARRLGSVEEGATVPVSPPGGALEVGLAGNEATLRGPVEHERDGEWVPGRRPEA